MGIYFMEHNEGLSLTTVSDVSNTLVVQSFGNGLTITMYTKLKSGDIKSCEILLNTPQIVALIEYLNPSEITR
jgi:hypothetical protein